MANDIRRENNRDRWQRRDRLQVFIEIVRMQNHSTTNPKNNSTTRYRRWFRLR